MNISRTVKVFLSFVEIHHDQQNEFWNSLSSFSFSRTQQTVYNNSNKFIFKQFVLLSFFFSQTSLSFVFPKKKEKK